ncbi:6-carboxytetrahydropterin synthase [Candidatus Obscuribacterales bacterium]|nr:6-carboxytetrahydropterin synthase [Candidatus Obscuribacterales bacterium]MBX3137565.1 6-carboxytetrahydropterin synthase [Candidatus Obscuribacterales bacterium]MBX3152508.1 6-carboxytetrahydropterin synthase [Candidatus Obscuribacterales bacterium]
MHKISRQIQFCYGHRLLNYEGKCKNLHGHNGVAVVTLESRSLDDLGMVADFSDVKKAVLPWIDEEFDHRMLLHKDDPLVPLLKAQGDPVKVLDVNPTAENIARLIFDHVKSAGFPVSDVVLWETPNCSASYSGE